MCAHERHGLVLLLRKGKGRNNNKCSFLCFRGQVQQRAQRLPTGKRTGRPIRVGILYAQAGGFGEHSAGVGSREQPASRRQGWARVPTSLCCVSQETSRIVVGRHAQSVQISLQVKMVRCCRNHVCQAICATEDAPVMCGSRAPKSVKDRTVYVQCMR